MQRNSSDSSIVWLILQLNEKEDFNSFLKYVYLFKRLEPLTIFLRNQISFSVDFQLLYHLERGWTKMYITQRLATMLD